MDTETKIGAWLERFLAQHGATSATIHLVRDGGLRLAAAVNIPPAVQQVVAWVPNGKGMAGFGARAARAHPYLQPKEDRIGNVKPGAKAVHARAAVAIPVDDEAGNVRAVVGMGFLEERDFSSGDLQQLQRSASTLLG